MMLRWISLVPPMIELARDARNPSAQRAVVDRVVVVGQRAARRARAPRARSRRAAGSCSAQNSFTRLDSAPISSPRASRASVPLVVQAEDLDVDPRLREPLPRERVVEPRRGRAAALSRRSIASSWSTCSFQTNEAPRSLASVVFATRQPSCSGPMRLLDRHLDVVEEDLVELALPGDLAQRADLDARRVHRDREHRDALVVRRVRVGADERDAPVGEARVRRPHLLAGDAVDVAALLGRGSRARARSLPASGSLNSWHHTSSPARIRGIHRRRCSSVPCAISVGPTRLMPGPAEQRRRVRRARAPRCRSRPAPATRRARRTRPASGCRPNRAACSVRCHVAQHVGLLRGRRDADGGRRVLGQPRAQLVAERSSPPTLPAAPGAVEHRGHGRSDRCGRAA